jgi:hypothetical protein
VSAAGAVGIGCAMRRRSTALAACLAALGAHGAILATTTAVPAATTRSCGSVSNPYPGTRYAGVDLTRITATGATCRTARSVARAAHRKALGITPSLNGIRAFTWNGWKVSGDLRPSSDRYVATRRAAKVRWRF